MAYHGGISGAIIVSVTSIMVVAIETYTQAARNVNAYARTITYSCITRSAPRVTRVMYAARLSILYHRVARHQHIAHQQHLITRASSRRMPRIKASHQRAASPRNNANGIMTHGASSANICAAACAPQHRMLAARWRAENNEMAKHHRSGGNISSWPAATSVRHQNVAAAAAAAKKS